jgi:preprotein translocase SecE subunit
MELTLTYLAEVRAEFKNVSWPTRIEATRLTLFVIGGSLLVGLFVGGVDAALIKLLGVFILG